MSTVPRVVVSAPSSGHGKTAISVGLLAALVSRGYRAAGFKIGPDYVDAGYLGLAARRSGRNLDPRLVGADQIAPLFVHGAGDAEIAVVEGTMGLYDGLAGRADAESTAHVAGLLRAPVVLVVDAAAMGQSVAALVHGFRGYDELLWLGGVILNRVSSDRHEQVLREALDDVGVPVIGALRRRALSGLGPNGAPLPPRHEGVGPVAQGSIEAERAVRRLGEVIARAVDLEQLLSLARSAPKLSTPAWSPVDAIARGEAGPGIVDTNRGAETDEAADGDRRFEAGGDGDADRASSADSGGPMDITVVGRRPLVAIAAGPRLTFGYAEVAELLRAAGAEITTIDPVRDHRLPDDVDALVIGGGLPETYAEELSANGELRRSVAAFARDGGPIVAEGTGLVWLSGEFAGRPMCGVIDTTVGVSDLIVLGYRQAISLTDSILLPAGRRVIGHKLHRTLASPRFGRRAAWRWAGGPAEGFVWHTGHASYLSLHWAGAPEAAVRLVAAARQSAARRTQAVVHRLPLATPTERISAVPPTQRITSAPPAPDRVSPAPAASEWGSPPPAAPASVPPISVAPPPKIDPAVFAPVAAAGTPEPITLAALGEPGASTQPILVQPAAPVQPILVQPAAPVYPRTDGSGALSEPTVPAPAAIPMTLATPASPTTSLTSFDFSVEPRPASLDETLTIPREVVTATDEGEAVVADLEAASDREAAAPGPIDFAVARDERAPEGPHGGSAF